eukprot:3693202-Rhodomonas_salina.2
MPGAEQTADDVRLVRRTLDEAGGQRTKIICKIENEEGLVNIDAIIRETDGVMVARGDLGMEIPAEKVALVRAVLNTANSNTGNRVLSTFVLKMRLLVLDFGVYGPMRLL